MSDKYSFVVLLGRPMVHKIDEHGFDSYLITRDCVDELNKLYDELQEIKQELKR